MTCHQFGHYYQNNKLMIIQLYHGTTGHYEVQISVVSFGQILHLEDVKETIKFIISNGQESQTIKDIIINKKQMAAYKYSANSWAGYTLDKRSFETIFLKEETITELRKEMESFFRVEQLYRDCDVPYRKGILLYGPPGTGKTSLVKALSYEYQIPVYMININDSNINDDTIVDMLNSIGGSNNKILLFEDIDSAFSEKEKVKFEEKKDVCDFELAGEDNVRKTSNKKYLTYAGLLNALDGVLSNHHGVITIMTTNYVEKLGEALIRPGRIDHKYVLGPCDRKQIVQMTTLIITKSITLMKAKEAERKEQSLPPLWKICDDDYIKENIEIFADNLVDKNGESKINPCKLQQYILKNIEDTSNVFKNYGELLK